MSTLAQAVTTVYRMLRDTGDDTDGQLLSDTEYGSFIASALNRYSASHPRRVLAEVEASGEARDELPDDWEDGFSTVLEVEHPADQVPREVRDPRTYEVSLTPDGLRLTWLESAPAEDDAVWLFYTVRHTIDASESTFPDAHYHAVCTLAASLAADSIAARYAAMREGQFGAEAVSSRTKAQEWQAVARRMEAAYQSALSGGSRSASGILNWDSTLSDGGDFLTHRRGTR